MKRTLFAFILVLTAVGLQAQVQLPDSTDGTCSGPSATIDAGVGYSNYLWNTGATGQVLTASQSGWYSVTVTDGVGVTSSDSTYLTVSPAITYTSASQNPACIGVYNGEASVTVLTGTAPYSYTWNDHPWPTSWHSRTSLSNTIYRVTITDAIGCTATESFPLNYKPAIQVWVDSVSHVTTPGGSDGSVTLATTGGSPPYTYNWDINPFTPTYNYFYTATTTGRPAGYFAITATDIYNCPAGLTFATINEPDPLTLSLTPTDESCLGASNGSVQVTANGATAPYTYLWSTGGSGATISSLSPGTYTVTVTGTYGTTAIGSATVGSLSGPIFSLPDTFMVSSCSGPNVTLDAGGGHFSYAWSTGDNSQTSVASVSGTYFCTVSDVNGCTTVDSTYASLGGSGVTFFQPQIDPGSVTICEGESLDLLVAGNGCNFKVNSLAPNGVSLLDISGLSGYNLGGIAVTQQYVYYTGGSGTVRCDAVGLSNPVVYGQREGIFSDLSNGDLYTFWSTSANDFSGYLHNDSIDGIRPLSDSLTLGTLIPLSQNIDAGTGSAVFAGPGFVILWATQNNTFYKIELSSGQVSTLGTYNLGSQINSANYWAAMGIVECAGPDHQLVFVHSSETKISRFDIGTNTLTTVQTFSDLSDMASITLSPWHDRWFFAFDQSNQFGSPSFERLGSAPATTGLTPGVGIDLATWSTGDTTTSILVSPVTTTNYSVVATSGGLTCTDSVTVTVLPKPVFNLLDSVASNCTAGSVILDAGPGFSSYLWSNGDSTQTTTISSSGYVFCTVTDANGCAAFDSTWVTVFSPYILQNDTSICQGQSVTLHTKGGASLFFMNNFSSSVNYAYRASVNSIAGAYSIRTAANDRVYYSDSNSTSRVDDNTAVYPFGVAYWRYGGSFGDLMTGKGMALLDTNKSYGGGFDWTPNIGSSLQGPRNGYNNINALTDGNNEIPLSQSIQAGKGSGMFPGQGFVVIWANYNDTFYYINTQTGQVTTMGTANMSNQILQNNGWAGWGIAEQNGSEISVVYRGWGGHDIRRYNLTTGQVSTVTSFQNLGNIATLVYNRWKQKWYWLSTSPNQWTSGLSTHDRIGAAPASAWIDGNSIPEATVSWNTGETTSLIHVTPNTTTSYVATTTLGNLVCHDTVIVTVNPKPVITLTDTIPTICGILDAGPGHQTYQWSTGDNTQTTQVIASGTYTVTVSNVHGCTSTDTLAIVLPPNLNDPLPDTVVSACQADSVLLQASGSYSQFQWSTGDTTQNLMVHSSGTYQITVTDGSGCTATDEVYAFIFHPQVTASSTTICAGDTVEFGLNTNNCGYSVNSFYGSGGNAMTNLPNTIGSGGSIAVTPDFVFYAGNNATARVNASDLSNLIVLPQRSRLFADAGSGLLYCPWNTGSNSISGTNIDAIRLLDTALNFGAIIPLSQTLTGNIQAIYPGSGIVLIHLSGTNAFYEIKLSTGEVTFIANRTINAYPAPGGFAECVNGEYRVYYRWEDYNFYYEPKIQRQNITTGGAAITAAYLCTCVISVDMDAIAISPWNNRWYWYSPIGQNHLFYQQGNAQLGYSQGSTSGYPNAGGAPLSNYLWNTGATSSTLSVSPTTTSTYTVTVTAGSSVCIDSVTVSVNPSPLLSLTDTVTVSCVSGPITLTADSGFSSYLWSTGDSTQSTSVLTAGTYSCTVTAGSGCTLIDSVVVVVNGQLQATCVTTPAGCNQTGGTAAVNVTTGIGPYTYSWNTGATSALITGLAPGTYTVTISDSTGCSAVKTTTVSGTTSNISLTLSTTNASSAGASDGTATVSVSGGIIPYTYTWSNGASTSSATGLSSGIYSVTVTDVQGCTATATDSVGADSNAYVFSNIAPLQCSTTLGALSDYIYYSPVPGATNYRIQITATGFSTVYVRGSSVPDVRLDWVSGIAYNTTYDLSVSAYVNGAWEPYGPSCPITTPAAAPTTSLVTGSCNITLGAMNDELFINPVPGATNYRYLVTASGGFSHTYVRGYQWTNFRLSWVPGVMPGTTYTVQVAAYINGAWAPYGSSCTLATPSNVPTTQLNTSFCNITLGALTDQLWITSVPGATNYRYEVTGPGVNYVYTRGYQWLNFRLSWIPGVQYGNTYTVRVAAYVGSWGNYGTACALTTPATIPASEMHPNFCNITATAWNSPLYVVTVPGATQYRYRFSTTGGFNQVTTRNSTTGTFQLVSIPNLSAGTTYDVEVAAFVGSWGNYGNTCTVTTPGFSLRPAVFPEFQDGVDPLDEPEEMDVLLYPNPTDGVVYMDFLDQEGSQVTVSVLDLQGRIVRQDRYPINSARQTEVIRLDDEAQGIYLFRFATENHTWFRRVSVN